MLRDLRFRDYHPVEQDFSTEPEDQQDDEKDAEDGERISKYAVRKAPRCFFNWTVGTPR